MANRKPVAWFTSNGQHIPILAGESQNQAYRRRMAELAKSEEDQKQKDRQIAQSKEEADKKNEEAKAPPRTLQLSDISADEANKTSDVLSLGNKKRFRFVKGSKITNVTVFAGAGTAREFRDAQKYADRYRHLGLGRTEDWQHCAGYAVITNGKITIRREVHWVQGKDGKVREAFIKVRKK